MKKTLLTTLILLAFALSGMAQQGSFAPQGAEWYFDVLNPWGMHHNYALFSVDGDTIIQGHQCSVIRQNFVETGPGHENGEFVYEENNKVYWFNPTTNTFTTLYDFAAEAGDSWYYEVGSCSHLVTVDSVGSVTWDGRTYRTQWVKYHDYQNLPAFRGKIIEGIGYEKGLFPSVWTCNGEVLYDASEIEYLRCYVENSEMVYHEGSYDCDYDEYTNCWDGTVAEAYEGGDGSEENPYQIATSQQLALLAQQTNNGTGGDAYYKLTSDINLGSCAGPYWQWVSIGTVVHPFTGHFNGDGNTILNMNQDISDGDSQPVGGLFGCTNDAEISNVNLMRCYVSGNRRYVGTLVGYAGLTNIYDCSIYDGYASTDNEDGVAGGLVGCSGYTYGEQGTSEQTYIIANCTVMEAVKVKGSSNVGGVVGQVNDMNAYAPYILSGCSMRGITDSFYVSGGHYTGGVVGYMWQGDMMNCVNRQRVVAEGSASNSGCVGGLAGMLNYSNIAECINYGKVESDETQSYHAGGIVGYLGSGHIRDCQNCADVAGRSFCGGIVGFYCLREDIETPFFIQHCTNTAKVTGYYTDNAGGIVGYMGPHFNGDVFIVECSNFGDVEVENEYQGSAGGILGGINHIHTLIVNSFNRGTVKASRFAGGILGGDGDHRHCTLQNVYNTGLVITEEETKGAIAFEQGETDHFSDCYWLGLLDNHAGVSQGEPLQHSCAFWPTTYYGEWRLDSLQFGHDLVEALNIGAEALVEQYPAVLTLIHRWVYDADHINDGYPVFSGIEMVGYSFNGTEWYYEIENENGTITYQHLEYAADTTVNDKEVKIIIRTNTLYDKGGHTEVTREYVYEENGIIYWWNKDLQEFTTLYDFGAQAGDEWEVKVGMESITMHVDSVRYYEYDGELYKMLMVSDENDVFSGNIVCGIGHQTSFFPERLMTRGKDYRVEGIRCFWRNGELVFKYGDKDCDEVYQEYHNDIDESAENQFNIHPNPTDGVLVVETRRATSLQNQTYRIINLMGQTLMIGQITAETQQVDVSNLPEGMYFISVGDMTRKFVVK